MLSFVIPLLLLALWFVTSASESVSPLLLPDPLQVLQTFVVLIENGQLAQHVGASALRATVGFALAGVTGILLGLCASNRRLESIVRFPLEALRLTPPLSLVPLLILWFGINEAPKVAVVFLSGFFPVYLNTVTAVRNVDPKLLDVAVVLNFSRGETLSKVLLPSALPGVLAGLRLGFGYCWRALVGAELVAASSGLGFMISEAGEMVKTDVVFVGILTIVVLGVLMDAMLSAAVYRTRRGLS